MTAFDWKGESLAWCTLPMGLTNSSGILVKIVNKIQALFTKSCVLAYLDDTLIMSEDEESHLRDINLVLKAFEDANLLIHPGKCNFGKNEMEFLGFKFTPDGILPSDKHVHAIRTYKAPQSVKELRTYLGLIQFFK